MPPIITDSKGRIYKEGDPDYEKVRLSNLESHVRELQVAIIDLQHRLSRVDEEDVQWPGDTYEPTHTRPFEGPVS